MKIINVMEKNKDMFFEIINRLTDREKTIMIEMDTTFGYPVLKILSDGFKRIKKAKPLKKEKEKKKLVNNLKVVIKDIFSSLNPSKETLLFHSILYSIIDLTAEVGIIPKIFETIADKKGIPHDKVINEFKKDVEFYNYSDTLKKEIEFLDKRVSKLLIRMLDFNDGVINKDNIDYLLNKSKRAITITNIAKKIDDQEKYERLKDIMRMAGVGRAAFDEFEFKYDKKENKNIKYVFTRIFNLIREMESELHLGKYRELVIKSFVKEGEPLTEKAVDSYLEYLYWLDGIGQLGSEYELIKDVA